MRKHTFVTDFFVICSTQSERQSQAIADQLLLDLKQAGVARLGIEGYDTGRWILQDFGGVIVHLFLPHVRSFYDLESLWQDTPKVAVRGARIRTKRKS